MEKKIEIEVRELAEQFFDEEVKMIDDEERKEEVELEKETYIGVWMRGYRAAEATKLHQAEEKIKILDYDNKRLSGELEGYKEAVDELKGQAIGWRPLLEDVLKLDDLEIAHVPEQLFKKIKTFLYGE